MSTTLTNGLKLPDKGSVDWYADMQSNYAILDGAVGTVAEHTTALSGKAPLVHTHGKADVTDLFNSANIWSASQTFGDTYIKNSDVTWGVEPSSAKHRNLYFSDSTDIAIGYVRRRVANGSQGIYVAGRAPIKNGQLDPTGDLITWGFSQIFNSDGSTYFQFDGNIGNSIVPRANNTYDLGSSSYQWNNLYAKNYYYDGTAWGLDKANTWSKNQSFAGERLENEDNASTHTCLTLYGRYDTVQSSGMLITRMRSNNPQGGLSENAASRLGLDVLENGVRTTDALLANIKGYKSETGLFTRCELYTTLASSRLGTSSNPWKLINDVNPGALSFPNLSDPDPINTRNWVISTPTNNAYTPSENGWLNVAVTDISPSGNEFSLYVKSTNFFATAVHKLADIDDSKGKVGLFIPVMAGITYYVVVKGNVSSAIISATFFPCLGSV